MYYVTLFSAHKSRTRTSYASSVQYSATVCAALRRVQNPADTTGGVRYMVTSVSAHVLYKRTKVTGLDARL